MEEVVKLIKDLSGIKSHRYLLAKCTPDYIILLPDLISMVFIRQVSSARAPVRNSEIKSRYTPQFAGLSVKWYPISEGRNEGPKRYFPHSTHHFLDGI
jgi:hypothetical protein